MRFLSLFALLGLAACSSPPFVQTPPPGEEPDSGKSPPSPITGGGDSGVDAGADTQAPPPPPNCDTSKLPTDDACVVDEGVGVFVSSSLGGTQGDGSRAKPLASLQAGIALAKATNRRVYACAETYAEAITLAESVSMFGYFDCAASWKVTSKHAGVLAPTSPAAIAKNVAQSTRVQAFDVIAPDVSAPSASSIAFVALSAAGLELVDVKLHGGKAGNGSDGVDAVQLTDSASKNGYAASGGYTCNPQTQLTCSSGPVVGAGASNACVGKGNWSGGTGGVAGSPGYAMGDFIGMPTHLAWVVKAVPSSGGAQPANASTALGGVDGVTVPVAGATGADGANGMAGGDVGTFDVSGGYKPASGSVGVDGAVGQGGGGGAGHMEPGPTPTFNYYWWGSRGGGGGAGGCPGLAAEIGGGGGASVGLLVMNGALRISSSVVESSAGGAGGKAGKRSNPTAGGLGGPANPASASPAQAGANGGDGGKGGISGNGGGGPSFAIAYTNGAPIVLATSLTPGSGGAGVAARALIDHTIPASASGKSAATYAF